MTDKLDLDAAIVSMNRIAEAVKNFEDAELRTQAFDILAATVFEVPSAPEGQPGDATGASERENDASEENHPASDQQAPKKQTARKASGRKPGGKKVNYEVPKDINFAPRGKKSFKDFASEKSPTNNNEKALVAAYYISDILEQDVTTGKVIAAFRVADWRPPAAPDNNLQQAGTRGWLDTKDMSKIEVVWQGRNFVEHDLPKNVQ